MSIKSRISKAMRALAVRENASKPKAPFRLMTDGTHFWKQEPRFNYEHFILAGEEQPDYLKPAEVQEIQARYSIEPEEPLVFDYSRLLGN